METKTKSELLIATHDSCTGEATPWYLWWTLPFARTQSKTLGEQYDAGCRYFDIRVREHNGIWQVAHGLWHSSKSLFDMLYELTEHIEHWKNHNRTNTDGHRVYISLTYEGKVCMGMALGMLREYIERMYFDIDITYIAVKYGKRSKGVKCKYDYLWRNPSINPPTRQGFLPLDGRSWHTYLPLPWLWDRLYKRPHEFNDKEYTFVDFL